MRAWITKYALTRGVFEVECETRDGVLIRYGSNSFANGEEWTLTKYAAIKKADMMREKKIASLHKQLEKLNNMTIKVLELKNHD